MEVIKLSYFQMRSRQYNYKYYAVHSGTSVELCDTQSHMLESVDRLSAGPSIYKPVCTCHALGHCVMEID